MPITDILAILLTGLATALIAGPLGCFIVWRRMAYFGDAIAHSALLGIALATAFHISNNIGVLIGCGLFAAILIWLQAQRILAMDTLLGLLAHSGLAVGVVLLSLLSPEAESSSSVHGSHNAPLFDIHDYLLGDITAVTLPDMALVILFSSTSLLLLYRFWESLLLFTVHEELAQAEGVSLNRMRMLLTGLLTIFVVIAVNSIGVLLMTSLLLIPAATARMLTHSPHTMALVAMVVGVISMLGGGISSQVWHLPHGPAIIVCAIMILIGVTLYSALRRR